MISDDSFVLIVGAGPVGLTLALDLGLRGVPAILVNENVETANHPKCNIVNGRSIEHFSRLGVANDIRRENFSGDVQERVSFRTRFCGHELGSIALPFVGEKNWPGPESPWFGVSQVVLESILKQHAHKQASIDLRFGWRATDITIDEEAHTRR